MLDPLLRGMTTIGPLVLGLAMLPAAVGLPVPVGMLLIAAGALVRQGAMDWWSAFLLAWLGATVSDALSYTIGRWTGRWAAARLGKRYATVWHRAEDLFRDHGGWAVFATSWLIRALAVPTNFIAGSSNYSVWRFLAWDAAGKVVWIVLHAGLGYAFASQWQLVSTMISRYGAWLGICAAAGIGAYLLLRRLRAHESHTLGSAL